MPSIRQALEAAWQHFCRREWQQAERLYLQVLEVDPHQVDAIQLLGAIAGLKGRVEEALGYLRTAVRLCPDSADAHNNLGNAYKTQGKLDEAVASFQEAVRLRPDLAVAYYNLGNALCDANRLEEAAANYERALSLKPDFAEAYLTLGNVRKDEGRLDDAIDAFCKALHLKPDAAYIHSNVIVTLNYHPRHDTRMVQQECQCWNRQHAEPLRKYLRPHPNAPDPERRLRVGYVSPDFRDHADSFFTMPVLANHDHRQFEIICYSDVARPDAVTEQLRGYADLWRSTVELTNEQVAEVVRGDQIDILIDLKLHTAKNRLLMFARKPAPVQLSWLGYPGPTGLLAIDYHLTDPHLEPPGFLGPLPGEEVVRLPETFWCYDPQSDEPPVNALPARTGGGVVFGCLNNFSKLNDGCLQLWARVLQAVPQSRLLLLAPAGPPRVQVQASLEQYGVSPSRMEFVTRLPRPEYLRLYHRVDLALDPFPCNGHTTSLDAFWMGVPTLTLPGKTPVGRAGWSQLCNLGLAELAADTPEQFVDLAARMAADLPALEAIRATLRQRMRRSPLMDGPRFTRHLEQAYRSLWRRW